jgi:hypothetical protein
MLDEIGINKPTKMDNLPRLSFKYWRIANARAIDLGNQLGGYELFFVLFEELCDDPKKKFRGFFINEDSL